MNENNNSSIIHDKEKSLSILECITSELNNLFSMFSEVTIRTNF